VEGTLGEVFLERDRFHLQFFLRTEEEVEFILNLLEEPFEGEAVLILEVDSHIVVGAALHWLVLFSLLGEVHALGEVFQPPEEQTENQILQFFWQFQESADTLEANIPKSSLAP
jgi:hypothetical protein